MQIQISNFPPGVTEDDVRKLLDNIDEIEAIKFTDAGNPENVVAWVEADLSRVQADAIVDIIDGKQWKGRSLKAMAALYLK
ncbi:RNA recognition motif domain-containing protein [Pseudomonadota bacterium]